MRANNGNRWRRALLDLLPNIVNARTGLINVLHESPLTPGAPAFHHVYAMAANTSAFAEQPNFANTGGAAVDVVSAAAKAVGEAVERYCGAIFDRREFPLESYESADFNCVHPDSFALHNPGQMAAKGFVFASFTEKTTVRWTKCYDAASGEETWVPAGMVYVPYFYHTNDSEWDSPIVQPISTGLACHVTHEQAAISAISEVIERDSVMITWQAMISPPQIPLESLSDGNYAIARRFEEAGVEVTMFDITTDLGVPVILSGTRCNKPGDEPAMVVAASADPDPETAARKSLEELAHTRRYSRIVKKFSDKSVLAKADEDDFTVKAQQDHLIYWSWPENLPKADFLFASRKRVEFGDIQPLPMHDSNEKLITLDSLATRIAEKGYRPLLKDLTTPDVRDAGLCVMRAVIPGLHPMFMGHDARALGGNRLWEVPQKLGHKGVNRETGDNPYPHPYP